MKNFLLSTLIFVAVPALAQLKVLQINGSTNTMRDMTAEEIAEINTNRVEIVSVPTYEDTIKAVVKALVENAGDLSKVDAAAVVKDAENTAKLDAASEVSNVVAAGVDAEIITP